MTSNEQISIATFEVDVTPNLGDPIEYGTVMDIRESLSCRGLILLTDDLPIVITAVDWMGNFNGGYDKWRQNLADAVGTAPQRVAVHAVHQHEAPGFGPDAINILNSHGIQQTSINPGYAERAINHASTAAQEAIKDPEAVSQIGVGEAKVKKVASNRQLVDANGELLHVRFSSGKNQEDSELPEGLIDPNLKLISFWDKSEPKAALSYYATHPQSDYGDGVVSCDFVGDARNQVENRLGFPLIHFTGAAGNVTAGKYNEGGQEGRQKLTDRMIEGFKNAYNSTTLEPISPADLSWQVSHVELPLSERLSESVLQNAILNKGEGQSLLHEIVSRIPKSGPISRKFGLETAVKTHHNYSHITQVARDFVWLTRSQSGHKLPLMCLGVNDIRVLHVPGEPFVEYQIAVSEMRPELTIAMAAYGDSAPFYIGTSAAYDIGGFELDRNESKVSPAVEDVLLKAFRELLDQEDDDSITTPSDITRERKQRITSDTKSNKS